MIAEENKDNARLKKRLKRLAVHQILVENWDTVTVADFSRDKHYDEVLRECQQRGL